jgi:hypothetical protein
LELPLLLALAPFGGGGFVNCNVGVSGAATVSLWPKGQRTAAGELLLVAASIKATPATKIGASVLGLLPSEALLAPVLDGRCGGGGPVPSVPLLGAIPLVEAPPAWLLGVRVGSASASGFTGAAVTANIRGVAVHRVTLGRGGGANASAPPHHGCHRRR